MTSLYNGQFYGSILVVGRTNCGKTTFIEKLGLNNFFWRHNKNWMDKWDWHRQTKRSQNTILF